MTRRQTQKPNAVTALVASWLLALLLLPAAVLGVDDCDCSGECETETEECFCVCCPASLLVAESLAEANTRLVSRVVWNLAPASIADYEEWFDDLDRPPQNPTARV
ncbi:MAG TPA: hypothetical protein VLB27_06300 [candidate division Zixibacteria bacterium]|nr:hypothetical protein [candidate division Zixibacteria bacterium]